MLAEHMGPIDHAVLIRDQGRWHTRRKLKAPDNIRGLYLRPHGKKFNPVGRHWGYLPSLFLSNWA